jgi:CubicO group peptidase (beta-lactamase class C family)
VLVERRGRIVYRGDFGPADRAFGVPVAHDTRFWVASITKTFTAVLVLQLVDEGRLELRAPIRRYLADYAGPGADRVTVHQLLNHTSGLEQYDRVASYEEAVAKGMEVYQLPHPPADLLARYASGRLVHAPGTAFDYNNADYVVLGAIVERVTGASYAEALRRRLLDPLGLTATGVMQAQAIVPRLAPTYMRADSAAPLRRDLPVYPENWWAAGAMYSTAEDLRAFARALYGGRLLRPATLRAMLTPGLEDYGYGLWVATQDIAGGKHRFAQRPGRIMGANVLLLRYLDDDVTVVILANTNVADTDAFGFFIGRTVLR